MKKGMAILLTGMTIFASSALCFADSQSVDIGSTRCTLEASCTKDQCSVEASCSEEMDNIQIAIRAWQNGGGSKKSEKNKDDKSSLDTTVTADSGKKIISGRGWGKFTDKDGNSEQIEIDNLKP